jgi:hypothetical protein
MAFSRWLLSLQVCFDYQRLSDFFAQLQVERVKGIINTNTGWFIINGTEQSIDYIGDKNVDIHFYTIKCARLFLK